MDRANGGVEEAGPRDSSMSRGILGLDAKGSLRDDLETKSLLQILR